MIRKYTNKSQLVHPVPVRWKFCLILSIMIQKNLRDIMNSIEVCAIKSCTGELIPNYSKSIQSSEIYNQCKFMFLVLQCCGYLDIKDFPIFRLVFPSIISVPIAMVLMTVGPSGTTVLRPAIICLLFPLCSLTLLMI